MKKQDKPKTLKERLEAFQDELKKIKEKGKEKGEELTLATLTEKFEKLAKWFLYGGYISVGFQNGKREVEERYRIYITTVEFYFHCEEDSDYKIEDPIVYHQNKKAPTGIKELPYFPLMTLHAHASGYDITFENGEDGEKYRASALIRAFKIGQKGNTIPQSTFLYDYLNGFPLLGETHIKWMDKAGFDAENSEEPIKRKRKNVYRYKMGDDGRYICDNGRYVLESEKRSVDYLDNREWSFSRKS